MFQAELMCSVSTQDCDIIAECFQSSCLIAQNLLKGCKTCSEVASRIATVEAERSYTPQEEFSSQEVRHRNIHRKLILPADTDLNEVNDINKCTDDLPVSSQKYGTSC